MSGLTGSSFCCHREFKDLKICQEKIYIYHPIICSMILKTKSMGERETEIEAERENEERDWDMGKCTAEEDHSTHKDWERT